MDSLIVITLNQSGDEGEELGNKLDFSNVINESECQMDTSLDNSSAMDDSMLSNIKEVHFAFIKSLCMHMQ